MTRVALLVTALVAACAPLRHTSETRYQGIVLDARRLGAEEIRRQAEHDPTLQRYLAAHGEPDFFYVATPRDTEAIYRSESRLVHFHRDTPGEPSTASELTPLPAAVLNILPLDLRAGTPGEGAEVSQRAPASCWRVPAGRGECRTCCKTSLACSTQCREG